MWLWQERISMVAFRPASPVRSKHAARRGNVKHIERPHFSSPERRLQPTRSPWSWGRGPRPALTGLGRARRGSPGQGAPRRGRAAPPPFCVRGAGGWRRAAGAGTGPCGPCGRPAAATGGGRRCPVRRGDTGESPGELCSRRWPSLGEEGSAGLTGCASLAEPRAVGGSSRRLCAEAERGVTYEELKELKKSSVVHIDVRERWEVDRDGKIPASINIPSKLFVMLPSNVCSCCSGGGGPVCGQGVVPCKEELC